MSMLLLIGCGDRSASGDATRSLKTALQNLNAMGLEFHQKTMSSGGTGNGFAYEVVGELVSTNGSPLPPELAKKIADIVGADLGKQGCVITGGGQGGGIHYTSSSQVRNANIERASVDYSLHGAGGIVEVLVIERDYMPDPNTKVVGQLVISLNQSK